VALTEAERRTLTLLADTFVPACVPERVAAQAEEALLRAADPAQVTQLRLVLRLLELGPANGLTGGPWRPFGRMSRREREAVLLRWATSRLGLRRSAFAAYRKLLTFLAYADPGTPEQPNALLRTIGYEPDRPPVTGDPTRVRVLDVPRSPIDRDDPITLEADVVVVGSGAGGGVVAAELATAGRSVVVLEAGPFVDEAAMPRSELEAYSRLYLNHGLLSTWDGAITLLAGSGVGGGTLVNWMTCLDVPSRVRYEWATEHGIDGLDGEWRADVEAIMAELSVSPSTVVPPKDELILRGAAALGWQADRTRRDARDCGACGSCPFGCAAGAKQSGIRVHLATAVAAGARLVDRVRVTRVLLDDDGPDPRGGAHGRRVAGVEARLLLTDPATGMPVLRDGDPTVAEVRRLIVRAPQVVLAAGALRSPAILQASGAAHPAVGRFLRVHPVAVIAARLRDPAEMWRGTMQAAASLEFSDGELDGGGLSAPRDNARRRRGYVIESAPGHPGLMALALPWAGSVEHAARMAAARHLAPLIGITRDGGAGRTTLTRAGRVRIDYRLDTAGVATLRHALVSMARLARAAGGVEEIVAVATPTAAHRLAGEGNDGAAAAWSAYEARLAAMDFAPNRGGVFSAHQMGTIRMGADPADHPADPRGRVRRDRRGLRIEGLYVADGSTFPTGIGVNPMIGIMAMARRVSRTVLAESRG
jgi:choline dehydrogenase-like flavoprotein